MFVDGDFSEVLPLMAPELTMGRLLFERFGIKQQRCR